MWNTFVKNSNCNSFLFNRSFVEYHNDRFQDYSLLIFKKNKLIALLPAHIKNNTVSSHMGLTYGGLVLKEHTSVGVTDQVFLAIKEFLKKEDIKKIKLKIPPHIYYKTYTSTLEFLITQNGGVLSEKDFNFVVNLNNYTIHKSKLKAQKLGLFSELELVEEEDLTPFWTKALTPVLKETYNSEPVHTLQEISSLKNNFPENIKQFTVYKEGKILAGMTLFVFDTVVKSQYGVVTKEGKSFRALDFMYLKLYEMYKGLGFNYFDMGSTTTKDSYNSGLTKYKEELGGIPINLDTYTLSL